VNLSDLTIVQGDVRSIPSDAVVVLEFWATWCPPCRQTIPHLSEVNTRYKDKNVYMVGITNEDNIDQIRSFVQKMGDKMNYIVAIDSAGSLSNDYMRKYHISGIPHAFILDRQGKVAWQGHPADSNFERQLGVAASVPSNASSSNASKPRIVTPSQSSNPFAGRRDYSIGEIEALNVKDLKLVLQANDVNFADCIEKAELIARIKESLTVK